MKKFLSIFVVVFILYAVLSVFDDENSSEQNKEVSAEKEDNTQMNISDEEIDLELSEEDYKALCVEMYYDEVFFGKDDLEGKYVKLHLMFSEKFYFTSDAMYNYNWKEYYDKYDLNRDFYKACVLREGLDSYVGRSIRVWFSNKNELLPSNYDVGQKIIAYAKVISWSNNTMDGYNDVTIIPKYIEMEE